MIPFRDFFEDEVDFWAQPPHPVASQPGKVRMFRAFLDEEEAVTVSPVQVPAPKPGGKIRLFRGFLEDDDAQLLTRRPAPVQEEGGFAPPAFSWPLLWESTIQRPPRRKRQLGARIILDQVWMGAVLTVKRVPAQVELPPRLVMAKSTIRVSPMRAAVRASMTVNRGEYELAVALGLDDVTDFR